MKKSEKYQYAMLAVLESQMITSPSKLEIIETLLGDKTMAEYTEKMEAEK